MKMVKITHKRISEIVNGYQILKNLSGVKLTYAITRNMKTLKAEVENLNESRYTSEKLKAYQEKYQKIVSEEIKKDKNGNPITVGQNQIALENPESFNSKIKELNEEYADELEILNDEEEKFSKFILEPIEINFFTFSSDILPESITVEQRELLSEMEEEST